MSLSQDPDGKLVIQELDSPITRREKARRKRRARSQLAAPPTTAADSDLSSLSELSEDEEGRVQSKPRSGEKGSAKAIEPGQIVLGDGKTLEGGTLVWAKAKNFPWWAAVVFEPDDPTVPVKVLRSRPTKFKSPHGYHLVQFYDMQRSWQWVVVDQLLLLGESDELDQSMLTTSKRQKFNSVKMRLACRESYRLARLEMETADDVAVDEAADTGDATKPEAEVEPKAEAEATPETAEPPRPPADEDVEMADGGEASVSA
ncbi:hypothetical protein BC834DRAFT_891677 [Gloeopeniophorella convolvens]|nr:hypothetical protein BC834DRAFT_891677 [Gloeopeniophorella convolvens]